jgi:hypothetical protein
MKKVFIVLLAVCGILSCSNSDSEAKILDGILRGEFIEMTPIASRTTLIFRHFSNQLQEKRAADSDNPIIRTFSIQLVDDGMIELSSNEADEMSPKVFHYQIIDDDTFEIGNINPNDNEDTIMTFKRI